MYQTLFKEAKAKATEAQTAAEEGRMDDYKSLIAEAKAKRNQAEAAQEAAKVVSDMSAPVMPVSLPTDDGGTTVQPNGKTADELAIERMNKSIYQLRYGEENDAVKAVLTDLHGPNYKWKRLAQFKAFVSYLRNYSQEPAGEQYQLLREIILTPEYAVKAIETGKEISVLKAVMVEALDTLGGYVVPVDFQADIIRRIRGLTAMRPLARISTTSRDKVDIPKMTGGDDQYTTAVRVTWIAETPTAGTADTNLTFGLESIPVHDVMAETFLSRNVVDDAAVDIVTELTTAFAEAAAIDEDNQFLTGDGTGKPKGIIVGGTTLETGVGSEVSLNANLLTAQGILNLIYDIPTQYRKNAVFILNRAAVLAMRGFVGGDGHYLWGSPGLVGQPATYDGYPLHEQETMPTIAAGNYPILFGDPQGYRIVDRLGMTVERYLDGSTARINQVLYIMRRRLGGQLTHPERWTAQLISA